MTAPFTLWEECGVDRRLADQERYELFDDRLARPRWRPTGVDRYCLVNGRRESRSVLSVALRALEWIT